MEDFVGERVADAVEGPGIGEGALEGVVAPGEPLGELRFGRGEYVEPASFELVERRPAFHHMERGTSLAPGFGEDQGALVEIKGGQGELRADRGPGPFPVEAAGDHQVDDQPGVMVEPDGQSFPDPVDLGYRMPVAAGRRGLNRSKQKWGLEPNRAQGPADEPLSKGVTIVDDVR